MPRSKATMADIGEFGLLRLLQRRYGQRRDAGVVRGIGDDAAVLSQVGPRAIVSTDMLIEKVDFDFAWATPRDVGHKAAAANLSDLAAMGARPRALLISLALRGHDRVADVLALMAAVDSVTRRYGAAVVGGDISATEGPLVVNVVVIGQCARNRELPRAAGRAGDIVLVSGRLGGAAAGLALLRQGSSTGAALRRRQLRPEPRIELGLALARWGRVRACADISDGLARDALHLPRSGCGVEIDRSRLPLARGMARVAAACDQPAWQMAMHGGEDFELVLAVAPRDLRAALAIGGRSGVGLTPVGRIVRGAGLAVIGDGGDAAVHSAAVGPAGFEHFRGSRGASRVRSRGLRR